MDVLEIPTIAQRISPEDETMPLCDSYEKVIIRFLLLFISNINGTKPVKLVHYLKK